MIVHQLAVDGGLDGNLSRSGRHTLSGLRRWLRSSGDVLPRGSQLDSPTGGFFVWVRLPERFDTGEMLPLAERLGVSFAPGARFGVPGAPLPKNALRLGFCGHPPEELRRVRGASGVRSKAEGAARSVPGRARRQSLV